MEKKSEETKKKRRIVKIRNQWKARNKSEKLKQREENNP
jgi:hypothetical protein